MLYLHVKHTTNNILTLKFGNQVFKQHQASCVHQLLPALWLADYVTAALLLPSLHFFQPGTVAANSLASKKFREQVFQHTGYEVLSCTQVAVRNNEPSAQPKFPQKTPRVTAISKWIIIKIIKASRMDELDKNTIKQETEIQCMHIPIFLRKGVYLVIFSSKFLGLKRFKKKSMEEWEAEMWSRKHYL